MFPEILLAGLLPTQNSLIRPKCLQAALDQMLEKKPSQNCYSQRKAKPPVLAHTTNPNLSFRSGTNTAGSSYQ